MSSIRWSRAFLTLGVALGLAGMVGSGCSGEKDSPPKAGLMLAIRTDMSIPDDISAMRIEVTSFGVTRLANEYPLGPLPDSTPLPGTLALLPPDDPKAPVKIRIVARKKDGTAIVMRETVTTVPDNRLALLPLNLQWLCWQSVKDTPESKPNAEQPNFENADCTPDQTCKAGRCADMVMLAEELPTYDAALVFGGGNGPGSTGKCFDTLACFTTGAAVPVDTSDCSVAGPAPGQEASFNVALVLPFGKNGICGSDSCLVPLEKDDTEGWKVGANGRVMLPSAVCPKIGGDVLAVAVSSQCETKTFSLPTCGPWSSVTSIAGNFDASGPSLGDAGQKDVSADGNDGGTGDAPVDAFTPPAEDKLGLPCTLDAQCGTLTCLEFDSGDVFGMGPAGGLCTRPCTGQAAGFCNFVKSGAECVPLASPGSEYCVEGCTQGVPSSDAGLDPNKCNGRADMACAKLTVSGSSKDVCVPTCNSDTQCPGMHCSPMSGLCTGTTPSGSSTGTDCGADAGTSPCMGVCSTIISPFTKQQEGSVCSAGCTIGEVLSCGRQSPTAPADAGCFKDGKPGSANLGDQGQCVELCDCSKSCSHPNQVCAPIGDGQLVEFYLHDGYCTHPLDEIGQPIPTLGC